MAASQHIGPEEIVVVDDDPGTRALLERFLTRAGYKVRAYADGAAAVRDAISKSPALVLTDINMPGLDGFGVLLSIRAVAPDLPVVIMTAESTAEIVRAAWTHGATDFIPKPFESLQAIVDRIRIIILAARDRADAGQQLEPAAAVHAGTGRR